MSIVAFKNQHLRIIAVKSLNAPQTGAAFAAHVRIAAASAALGARSVPQSRRSRWLLAGRSSRGTGRPGLGSPSSSRSCARS